ncbi:AIPR family protein [Solirubrobacter ginsenosidimutans]|uniref:AIPR family protein n=1 Tax=Solirubrobacter ginsenosidimutans TaxID=490573 RepID=A0A9X3MUV5_9ACTN|nr:AIPR family protein [Solirubrobacter ginsenosidimutans]MDA0163144.1 AIPR family protein [Solirubrobacter ginsenosidimutans]
MPTGADNHALLQNQLAPHHIGNRTESTALLAWFLENVMREEPDQVEDAICDGGGDKGVDAIVFDEDANELFVLQSKHRKAAKPTQGDADLKSFMGVAAYFDGPVGIDRLLASSPNEELANLIARLDLRAKFETAEPTVRLVFVTNAARDSSAKDYLKAIRGKQPTIDLWDRPRLVDVARRTQRSGLLSADLTFHPVGGVIETSLASAASMALALVPATELVRLPGIENLTIFDLNVRLGLGNTKINRELRATIKSADEHASFPAYHNGLTLLTDRLIVDDEGVNLEGVGVVNGCQSLLSLWRERDSITPALNIVVKVVETGGRAALADRITYRSNNQNPVNTRDLRSNDRVQRDLQQQIKDKFGDDLFYDIRRGQPTDGAEAVLDNQLAAQMLLAVWLKEPWAAVRKLKLFDQDYHRIFKRATAENLFLAYLLNRAVENARGDLRAELQTSFASVRFTLAYLAAVVIRQSEVGELLFESPERWLPGKTKEITEQLKFYVSYVVDEMNFYVADREEARQSDPDAAPFDPKTIFKASTGVRPLERQVVQAVKALARRPNSDILFTLKPGPAPRQRLRERG